MASRSGGDHPITDIVVHGRLVFSPEIDALIAEIDGLGGWDSTFAQMAIAMWHSTWQGLIESDPDAAAGSLDNLRFTLRGELERLLRQP